jgi:hypothetical protein
MSALPLCLSLSKANSFLFMFNAEEILGWEKKYGKVWKEKRDKSNRNLWGEFERGQRKVYRGGERAKSIER